MVIDIYGSPMCGQCESVMNFLESHGFSYRYHNVTQMSFDEISYLLKEITNGDTTLPIIVKDNSIRMKINELEEHVKRMVGSN